MARNKTRKRPDVVKVDTTSTQARRGHFVTATRSVSLPLFSQDRRRIPHELRQDLFVDNAGIPAQVVRKPDNERKVSGMLPALYHKFNDPQRVPICVRRQTRRRVLFALHYAGRGKSPRPRHWTAQSFIRCK